MTRMEPAQSENPNPSNNFRQTCKRSRSLFGMLLCLVFVWLPLDSRYFQKVAPAGLEETPWVFWGLILVGAIGSIGFAWQLIRPPLVIEATRKGLSLGHSLQPLEIDLSWIHFSIGFRSKQIPVVPWEKVRSLSVDRVHYRQGAGATPTSEPALRIEFDPTIDMSGCDDMLAIQAGTKAYFDAWARQSGSWSVSWQEPEGGLDKQNIVLIGQQHFKEDVQDVCSRLRRIMTND